MIVIEDVDLIAEDRGMHPGQHPLLFQLLNEMDGLAEDADVVFLLTTNRADLLEPALAARPGRVDQAVALELPDADGAPAAVRAVPRRAGRRRGPAGRGHRAHRRGHRLVPQGAAAPGGRPGRRGAAGAPCSGPSLTVSADQLDAALDELLDTRNAMTRVLLGGQRAPPHPGCEKRAHRGPPGSPLRGRALRDVPRPRWLRCERRPTTEPRKPGETQEAASTRRVSRLVAERSSHLDQRALPSG